MISANSPEFLDPIYKALRRHIVHIKIAPSRTGGLRLDHIVFNKKHFDEIRESYYWKQQAIVNVLLKPEIVFEGKLGLETLNAFWTKRQCEFLASVKRDSEFQETELVDYCFEWVKENEGKEAVVIIDPDWKKMIRAIIPMPDGTIQTGAY